jgi:hypothetical protein
VHRDFADWYRAVALDPKAEELEKRWKAIEVFSKNVDAATLAELIRLFYDLCQKNPKVLESIRQAFKAADLAFPMQGNDAEMRVLAGTILAHITDNGGMLGTAGSLGTVTTACEGLRAPAVPGILVQARKFLVDESAALRHARFTELKPIDITAQVQALKTALTNNQFQQLNDPLCQCLEAVSNAVGEVVAWAEESREEQQFRQEESDVLWWLVGAHSRDLKKPFGELEPTALPLVVGKELADLTRILPGPFAAEAFLDKAMTNGRKLPSQV